MTAFQSPKVGVMSGSLRIKHRIGEIEAFFNQTLLPAITDLSLRARHPKVLSKYRNNAFPQWEVSLRSSHSRKVVFHWLLSKRMLGFSLSKGEDLIFYSILSSDQEAEIFLLSKEKERNSQNGRIQIEQKEENLQILIEMTRILHGFQPSVIYSQIWNPVRITPLRRIGVGYKDKGHLGSEPSWKDQILTEEEDSDLSLTEFQKRCFTLLREYDKTPPSVLSGLSPLKRSGLRSKRVNQQ